LLTINYYTRKASRWQEKKDKSEK